MLKIRLKRAGRKKRPYFHVVVAEHSRAASKKYVLKLGGYNPLQEDGFEIDLDQFRDSVRKGAQPSNTVARLVRELLEKKGEDPSFLSKFIVPMKDRRKKKQEEESSSQSPSPSDKADGDDSSDASSSDEAPKTEAQKIPDDSKGSPEETDSVDAAA